MIAKLVATYLRSNVHTRHSYTARHSRIQQTETDWKKLKKYSFQRC